MPLVEGNIVTGGGPTPVAFTSDCSSQETNSARKPQVLVPCNTPRLHFKTHSPASAS